jgi:hypothetical protein
MRRAGIIARECLVGPAAENRGRGENNRPGTGRRFRLGLKCEKYDTRESDYDHDLEREKVLKIIKFSVDYE